MILIRYSRLTILGITRHKDDKGNARDFWDGQISETSCQFRQNGKTEKAKERKRDGKRKRDQFCSENKSLPRQRVPHARSLHFIFFPSINPAECRRDLSLRLFWREKCIFAKFLTMWCNRDVYFYIIVSICEFMFELTRFQHSFQLVS